MKINLNIDQVLQHVLPWDFSVTIGGQTYPTRRPSIAELGMMQASDRGNLESLTALINSLFVQPPPVRWDVPAVMAFLNGYLQYFTLHTEKKSAVEEAHQAASAAAKAVAEQWSGQSSSG